MFYDFILNIVIVLIVVNECTSQSQYYYQALNSYSSLDLNNYDQNQQLDSRNAKEDEFDNYIEKKYVNSGQSILLICDLPNSMPDGKVLFIKYDKRGLNSVGGSSSSGQDIREDTDNERYEIGQQYAWEWSLKINSISEDDSALYVCKVGDVIIKKFEIIVRVPPRIKDDELGQNHKIVREGSSVEFKCSASGTPTPNITWYMINPKDNTLQKMQQHKENFLRIENITRTTARKYQCRASNNIPPSDTRNLTFSVEFAPEIQIQSKYDIGEGKMALNCSINAFPLTNRNFWRKDGNFLIDGFKYEIKNERINEFSFLSQLIIKYYDELDQGLYECAAENDLRVSKIVYDLKEDLSFRKKVKPVEPSDLILIGSSNKNNYLLKKEEPQTSTLLASNSSRHHQKSNRKGKLFNQNVHSHQLMQFNIKKIFQHKPEIGTSESSSSINNLEYPVFASINSNNKNGQLKKQPNLRNHKHNLTRTNLLDKIIQVSSTSSSTPALNLKSNKSPYIILINEESSTINSNKHLQPSSKDNLKENNDESDIQVNNKNSFSNKNSVQSYINQQIEVNDSKSVFKLDKFILFLFINFCLLQLLVV